MAAHHDVLIVGAGQAGAQAALSLRQLGFAGSIAIVGDEPELPYERPPLSKDYLAGDKAFERLLIRPRQLWHERAVSMILNERVAAVDPAGRTVTTENGDTLSYGVLVWAAGGRARRLPIPGAELDGVHVVRSRADVDRMMAALPGATDVVVIGGGYIGLEAAAVLAGLGKSVTILEAQDRVLARVAGKPISRFYEAEHRGHGVDIRLGASIAAIEGEGGAAVGVRLSEGGILSARMVIMGVGISPSVEPLIAAGAVGGNGVDVDGWCRTSLPHIYAIGDCAAHENSYCEGARIRLESIQNANDQAGCVAAHIIDKPAAYDAVPWFWSNQYDLKLQTVGLSTGHDDVVVRGDPATRSFSVIYLRQGVVIALDCVNVARDYVQGRQLVIARATPPRARIADVTVPLKELAGG